jgi:hypothetical protein
MHVDAAQGSPDLEQRLGAASPGGMVYVEGFRLLSRAAVDLHAFAGLSSITEGHPGFVSDDYLIAKSAQARTAVTELEIAGV